MAPKKPGNVPTLDLDPREIEILRSVIREHVLTGEPIGSRTVSRGSRIDLSPASIRSIMGALEERGLLTQPHPSAGRIPTDRAYRFYVDQLLSRHRLNHAEAQEIDRAVLSSRGGIAELLGEASRQLSRFSNHVGIVIGPQLRQLVVEHLEFVRLDSRRVVAILVGRSGLVHNRLLEVGEPIEQPELDRIGRALSEEFAGRTLPEIRRILRRKMSEERAAYDDLLARSLELGRQAVEAESGEADVFVEGASNLLDSPEFNDVETIRGLMRTLEERKTLIELLSRVLDDRGVQVIIGEENPSADLAQCSLVAASYGEGGRVMGSVGIVGPTRMEYARAIVLVEHLARVLTRFFSSPEN